MTRRMSETPGDRTSESARRAEEIRRRRTARSQERVSQVSNRISSPAPARPVITRDSGHAGPRSYGGFKSTPLYRQASTRPRRQFYVAMDSAAGSELRLPAIPMINPGWRAISAVLVILALIGIFSLLNSPFFRVTIVDVQGLERLNGADLQAVLRLENLSIIEIQPDKIQELVAASFPELADVRVEISLPNAVVVSARERQPVMAWQKGDNLRWIDTEGYVFPARGEAGPMVTINTDDEIPLAPLTPEELAKVQEWVKASGLEGADPEVALQAAQAAMNSQTVSLAALGIPGVQVTPGGINRKADVALLKASLLLTQKLPEGTMVVYDQMNGLGWNDPQGWQVYIGKDLENFDAKFALYQAITSSLSDQGIRPNLISVEHLNAPFYRVEAPESGG